MPDVIRHISFGSSFMKPTTQFAVLAVLLLIAMGLPHFAAQAESKIRQPDEITYRTMFRQEIDQLGGYEKDKPLRVNSTEWLEAGLNKMSDDGWELVAVEGGRSVPITGPNQMKFIYPPVYIFRRSAQ